MKNGQLPGMDQYFSFDQPNVYTIEVKGRLDRKWVDWFDGLQITYEADNTLLQGSVADQSALFGILTMLNDLGLSLLSVSTVEQPQDLEEGAQGPPTRR